MTEHPSHPDQRSARECDEEVTRERLGFREIVPQLDSQTSDESEPEPSVNIPEFDLGRQMMARHRERSASKRKSPREQALMKRVATDGDGSATAADVPEKQAHPGFLWTAYASHAENALIAEIVRRDIAMLCRPWREEDRSASDFH